MIRAPHVVEIERVVVDAAKGDPRMAELVRRRVEAAVMSALMSRDAGLDEGTMQRVSQRAGEGAAGALKGGEG